jgi:rfaE bifunctional protein kinase chain/domain
MPDILEKIEQFKDKHILVIGDVMLDHYLFGDVHRISPEAPVPVVQLTGSENRLGGAANVAANIKALGAKCSIAGRIGSDQAGADLKDKLNEWDIDRSLIFEDARVTTRKTRIMQHEHQLLRIDDEDITEADAKAQKNYYLEITEYINHHRPDLIILQDYNKGFISSLLIEKVLAQAKEKNIPVAVDPKEKHFFEYKNVQLFKPNLRESELALQHKIQVELNALSAASSELQAKLNAEHIIITLAAKGIFIQTGKEGLLFPAQERKVSDVSGAGDSVIAALSLGYCCGFTQDEMGLIGNIAGGQVCELPGVVQINFEQLKNELGRHSHKKNKLFVAD